MCIKLDSIPLGHYLEYHWKGLLVLRGPEDKFLGCIEHDWEGEQEWNCILKRCVHDKFYEKHSKRVKKPSLTEYIEMLKELEREYSK